MEVTLDSVIDEAFTRKSKVATSIGREFNLDLESTKQLVSYMQSHNMTLLDIQWYTGSGEGYGIVSVRLEYTGEEKHYLKKIIIGDPAADALDILQSGAKFYPQAFAKFIM